MTQFNDKYSHNDEYCCRLLGYNYNQNIVLSLHYDALRTVQIDHIGGGGIEAYI